MGRATADDIERESERMARAPERTRAAPGITWPQAVVLYVAALVAGGALMHLGAGANGVVDVEIRAAEYQPYVNPAGQRIGGDQTLVARCERFRSFAERYADPVDTTFGAGGAELRSLYVERAQRQCDRITAPRSAVAIPMIWIALAIAVVGLVAFWRRGPRLLLPPAPPPLHPATDPAMRCSRCQGPRPRRPTPNRRGSTDLCVTCEDTKLARGAVLGLAWSGLGIVTGSVLLVGGGEVQGDLLFGVSVAIPLLMLQVVPHELGHALAGRAAGLRILEVSMGTGPELLRRRRGGTEWVLRALPLGGHTMFAPTDLLRFPSAFVLSVVAGPGVSIVLFLAAMLWVPGGSPGLNALRWAVMGSAACVAISNLVPRRIDALRRSDGAWLADMTRMDADAERQLTALFAMQGAIVDATRAGTRPMVDEAVRGDLQMLAARGDANAVFSLQHLLMLEERWGEAADAARSALVDLPDPDRPRAVMCNALAWTLLRAGRVTAGGDADTASLEAFTLLPNDPAVLGTRGSVLIELGATDEGLALLDRSAAGSMPREARASTEAYRAIGEADRGAIERASEHAAEAERLHPKCVLLPRMRARLAGARTSGVLDGAPGVPDPAHPPDRGPVPR